MNWTDWYTDLCDVWRVVQTKDGALTKNERAQILTGIPCRVYESDRRALRLTQTAADVSQEHRLACGLPVDIRAGDELVITRGGRLGKEGPKIRAFAGEPGLYYEPFGAILPGLGHQEIRLLQETRVDSLEDSQAGDEGL